MRVTRGHGRRKFGGQAAVGSRVWMAAVLALLVMLALAPVAANAAVPAVVGTGFHPFPSNETNQDVQTSLHKTHDVGANTVRVDAYWSLFQPNDSSPPESGQGTWAVGRLDSVVNGASALGMKTLVQVQGTPCWATKSGTCADQNQPPKDINNYGLFIGWLTSRYGSKLAGVEMWNEANSPPTCTTAYRFTPTEYAQMVEAMHADRTNGVPVVAGALSECGGDDLGYMDSLWQQSGFASSFDIWSTHAYSAGPPGPNDAPSVINNVRARRDKLTAKGSSVPIWEDEFGWSTCQPYPSCGAHPATLANQGTLLTQTFQGLTDPTLGVTGAMSYELRDDGLNPTVDEQNYGIVTNSYVEKPAYSAVRTCLTGGAC